MTKKALTLFLMSILCVTILAGCAKEENIIIPIPSIPIPSTQETVEEHIWLPANYQEPETCKNCGETRGEPLTPVFELKGANINAEEGQTYKFTSIAFTDLSVTITGDLEILGY